MRCLTFQTEFVCLYVRCSRGESVEFVWIASYSTGPATQLPQAAYTNGELIYLLDLIFMFCLGLICRND